MAIAKDSPLAWTGVRKVAWTNVPCGWCSTALLEESDEGTHKGCAHEIAWYDNLWLCGCECNAEWKPRAVVVLKGGELGEVPEDLVIAAAVARKRRSKKKQEENESSSEENPSE